MSIRVRCPCCDKPYNLDNGMRGTTVLCRECKSAIEVPDPAWYESREEDRPAREERLGTNFEPWGSGERAWRDEEEDPRGRRPDGLRREEAPSNNYLVLILAGVGGAAFLFVGLVVAGLFLAFSGTNSATPPPAVVPPAVVEVAPLVVPDRPPVANPDAGEPIVPAGPVPTEIGTDDVQKVKQATAYLRVNLPNGNVAEGSGFFALKRGIVITNAHVLGMLRANSRPPRNVDVVINSGEPNETKRVGEVLGVDRTNDLAVLRLGGDLVGLPPPLPVDTAAKLTLTQKVYIFGFPLGAELGKSITVSPSTIASLRRDDRGVLKQLQVNGGMHPGNSGGPVTDARGVVVGVSVAGIVGTQINFAIPGDFVKKVMVGLTPPAPAPIVNKPPDAPLPARPDAPTSSLLKDVAALKGAWESGDVRADGGGATGTLKLQFRPIAGKVGGEARIDVAIKRGGNTIPAGKTFNFTLIQKGDDRLLVETGMRNKGLVFTCGFDGGQLVLSGKVVARTIAYTLTKVAFRRVSANADFHTDDPTKGGGTSRADAIKITGDVFTFVQAAVKENRLADVDVRGSQGGTNRYRDVPAEGGVLIGFQAGLGKWGNNPIVTSWRPIFLTKTGEKFGQWQGPAPAAPITVKARAGYVVSGMTVRTAVAFDSIIVTFAKLGKNGLDLSDAYNSEKIGGEGGFTTGVIGGRGALFVGITGHLNNEMAPTSIGLVAVLPKE